MNLRVFSSEKEAAEACAARLAEAVRLQPDLVLGLPTGRTPLNVYRELVALTRRGGLDLSRVVTFNLDEFLGLPPEDAGSFRAYMERHLFHHVNLAPERIHFLDGSAEDAEAECARYDAALAAAGGLDLLLLGIGPNGHIAFNEPGESLVASCHRARLSRETRLANAMLFGDDPSRVPMAALTLGVSSILQARRVVLLAFGASKAAAVTAMLHGPVTPHCPASFLQLHRDVEVWLDEPAARGVRHHRPR
ncbi:glucosamine-6-phosphate deaminase [Corallococcus sp. H22C18031201]|uniref:glucosamine-6-phosphate deaminase n=1 Tax=Citreicoccus inhibens TaxID=2849499 RepID=UPI000E7205F8|nr:glucosamine-6-phosphate deaminase [Citreicoccus inhibens]MBU8895465.1 glucosamine-6-phosphate deaminase [Citreicoccus inhibens]RJS22503.1 glucosamine-6-phosphate deaminase [Corallococcus sp. H22C18031201]